MSPFDYLRHVNRLRVQAVDQLAEDDSIPKELEEIVRSGTGGEGGMALGDHFELVEPRDALLPQWLHDVDYWPAVSAEPGLALPAATTSFEILH